MKMSGVEREKKTWEIRQNVFFLIYVLSTNSKLNGLFGMNATRVSKAIFWLL